MVNFIIALLTGLDVLIAFCMIVLILMQQSKGGGLGSIGGGDMSNSVFGAGSGNVLTKTTTILAACFLAITLALAVITGHRQEGSSVVESLPADSEQQTADDQQTDDAGAGADAGAPAAGASADEDGGASMESPDGAEDGEADTAGDATPE